MGRITKTETIHDLETGLVRLVVLRCAQELATPGPGELSGMAAAVVLIPQPPTVPAAVPPVVATGGTWRSPVAGRGVPLPGGGAGWVAGAVIAGVVLAELLLGSGIDRLPPEVRRRAETSGDACLLVIMAAATRRLNRDEREDELRFRAIETLESVRRVRRRRRSQR